MPSDVDTIIEALGPREVIEQAVDVLMTRHEVSRDDALDMLVEGSSGSHAQVRVFAATIIQQRRGE